MITSSSFDRSEPEGRDDDAPMRAPEATFLQRRRRPAVYAAPAVVSLWGDRFVAALSGTDLARVHPV